MSYFKLVIVIALLTGLSACNGNTTRPAELSNSQDTSLLEISQPTFSQKVYSDQYNKTYTLVSVNTQGVYHGEHPFADAILAINFGLYDDKGTRLQTYTLYATDCGEYDTPKSIRKDIPFPCKKARGVALSLNGKIASIRYENFVRNTSGEKP